MKKSSTLTSEPEKVLVVSVDFDGCMGHTNYTNNYIEQVSKKQNELSAEERKKALQEVIRKSNPALIQDIQDRAKDFDRIVVIVGSNRQSANKDQHDSVKNKNGSCFEATERLSEVLQQATGKTVELDQYLVFDSILDSPFGTNFRQKTEQPLSEESAQYQMSMDKKYRLAFFQMHEICARHKEASVSYVHYDDRNDIVNDTAKAFAAEKGENMPPNLKNAKACHYELYNPVASIQSIANISKKEKFENPDRMISASDLEGFVKAIEGVTEQCNILNHVAQSHQNSINEAISRRDELKKTIAELDKGTEAYRNNLKEINSLDIALDELNKPARLIKGLTEIKNELSEKNNGDLSRATINLEQFNSLAEKADKLLNSNIRGHNLSVIPSIYSEYSRRVDGKNAELLKEMGDFTRESDLGHQMDMRYFDSVVKECMKDTYIEKENSSDPFSSFREEENSKKVEVLVKNLEAKIIEGTFKPSLLDKYYLMEIKNIDERKVDSLMKVIGDGYMRGNISSEALNKCVGIRYKNPAEQLDALEGLYQRIVDADNTLYNPSRNPIIRFFKGLGGKENNSAKQLNDISRLQAEYVRIARENSADPDVQKHVCNSKLPDFETRFFYIGINHATKARNQLMDIYETDPDMTLKQLLNITDNKDPFNAPGIPGFVATQLLNPKKRLANFEVDQISNYIEKNPEQRVALNTYLNSLPNSASEKTNVSVSPASQSSGATDVKVVVDFSGRTNSQPPLSWPNRAKPNDQPPPLPPKRAEVSDQPPPLPPKPTRASDQPQPLSTKQAQTVNQAPPLSSQKPALPPKPIKVSTKGAEPDQQQTTTPAQSWTNISEPKTLEKESTSSLHELITKIDSAKDIDDKLVSKLKRAVDEFKSNHYNTSSNTVKESINKIESHLKKDFKEMSFWDKFNLCGAMMGIKHNENLMKEISPSQLNVIESPKIKR